jgi:predicted DNA-binding WGR domain protein
MKRFELSDGSSNKFWQIAREGNSLRVTFGKIGTAGQTQLKELASEAAAIAEHDKLIKEKTKKGYTEVGEVAASPSASVKVKSAKPAEAASPVEKNADAAAEVVATPAPAPKVHVAPQGGYVLEERYVGTGPEYTDGTYASLVAFWADSTKSPRRATEYADMLSGGKKGSSANLKPHIDALIAFFRGDEKRELEVPAAAIWLRVSSHLAVIPYLVKRYGIVRATEVYIAAHKLEQDHDDGKVTFENSESSAILEDEARAIAHFESQASAADRKKVSELVRAAREEESSRTVRAEYNIVLRDEALAAADHAANGNNDDWMVTRCTFLATRDPQLQKALAKDVDPSIVLEAVGVAGEGWVLPKLEKDNWLIDTLFDLESVAGAKTIANDLKNKKTHERVKEYFDKRPDLALRALGYLVATGSKLAPFAKPIVEATLASHPTLLEIVTPLLDAKTKAYFLSEKKPTLPEAAASAVPEALRADPKPGVDGYPKKVAPLPDFATQAIAAAPISINGANAVLPAKAVERIVQAARYLEDAQASSVIKAAKETLSTKDLAAFGWELFERWQAAGAPNKESWGFTALGILGDDDTARKLTPLIRAWPGESLHARATVGLDVLAVIGTDVALMHLHGIAQKLKFKALQEKARQKIAEVAKARGFTSDELADRLVPDFDLGDEGGDVLDFGPRKFTIAFDETLKPTLKGSDGKVLSDLPKPNKADDAEKANAATERWKALKKDAKMIASGQVLRLELAMCSERRWKVDVFQTFLVEHPVVVHLVRRLVWGVYEKGALKATFRVAEDGTLADHADDAYTLPKNASIGLVHRLSLDKATLSAWSKIIGDYEIIQPFDQLGRSIFEPTDKEKKDKCVDHLGNTEVKTSRLLGLEARGWRKGEAQDAGWVYDMWRDLEGGIRASFSLEGGICMGAADMNPTTQKIGAVHFHIPQKSGKDKEVGLDAISAIVFSELARERESLRD